MVWMDLLFYSFYYSWYEKYVPFFIFYPYYSYNSMDDWQLEKGTPMFRVAIIANIFTAHEKLYAFWQIYDQYLVRHELLG